MATLSSFSHNSCLFRNSSEEFHCCILAHLGGSSGAIHPLSRPLPVYQFRGWRGSEMFLLHPSDGCLLADRGPAPADDLHDPYGVAAHAWNHVNR